MIQSISKVIVFIFINLPDSNTRPTTFGKVKMSSIHRHPTRTSLCLQPPRAIRTIHSFMPAFSASTMPMSFALVVIHNTMKSGLNFYGLDGTNTKARMCNGVTQNWTRFPILPSPWKVHLDSLTPTMCYVHAISYLSSLAARGTRTGWVSLAVRTMCTTGLSIM